MFSKETRNHFRKLFTKNHNHINCLSYLRKQQPFKIAFNFGLEIDIKVYGTTISVRQEQLSTLLTVK